MSPRGFFITLEGGEGAGKSTQVKLIKDYLESHGRKVLCLREPGGTRVAEQIRAILKTPCPEDELCDKAELLLMYAARAQLVETVIKPALSVGTDVICDRHDLSTVAYQGGGRGLPMKDIEALRQVTLGAFRPDLTLLLDLPAEQGLSRARSRGPGSDRFERAELEFFERVREAYLTAAARCPSIIKKIDATLDPGAVFSQIKVFLESLYGSAAKLA